MHLGKSCLIFMGILLQSVGVVTARGSSGRGESDIPQQRRRVLLSRQVEIISNSRWSESDTEELLRGLIGGRSNEEGSQNPGGAPNASSDYSSSDDFYSDSESDSRGGDSYTDSSEDEESLTSREDDG